MDNCGLSVRSATTRGGVEFDDLVTERVDPSYTFRLTRIKSTCKRVECAPTHSRMNPEHTATTTMGDLCSVSSLSTQLLAFVNINCSHSSCLSHWYNCCLSYNKWARSSCLSWMATKLYKNLTYGLRVACRPHVIIQHQNIWNHACTTDDNTRNYYLWVFNFSE